MFMLPRPPDLFVGRQSQLSLLLRRIDQGGVILVQGPSGMGKSTLALQAARRLVGRPVHWLSTRHHGQQPASLLFQLGQQGDGDLESLLLRWLPTLELERACIFIDELDRLHDATRFLEPFLEYLSGAALVGTCDERLPLNARQRSRAFTLTLGALNRDEATALLEHFTGEPARSEVLERAGGIPLALCAQGLDWLPLSPTLELLAIARYGLPLEVIGGEPLESLERRFLVERRGDWVHLHPDLAGPLTRQISPERQRSLHLQVASAAGENPLATAYHLVEAGELTRAKEVFYAHIGQWQQQGRFEPVVELASHVLGKDGHWGEGYLERGKAYSGLGQLELSLADFASAILWGEPLTRLRCHNHRCHLLLDMGRLEEAEWEADRALDLAGPPSGRIKALTGKARVNNVRGALDLAQLQAQEALDLAVALGDLKGEAYARFILGQTRWEQQRWQECLQLSLQGLELARQAQELRLTFLCRFWVGAALLRLGKLHQAGEILEQTWRESRAFADVKMRTLAELMQAQSLQLAGRNEQSLVHLRSAEQHLLRCSYPILAIHSLILRGTVEGDERWAQQAAGLAQQAGVARSTLISPGEKPFRVLRQEGCSHLDQEELDKLRSQTFDLVVDLPGGTASVEILSKKLLVRLLRALLAAGEGPLSTEQLHAAAWDYPFEGEASSAQVRKNIGALRKLVGAQAILVREHSFGQAGGYYFSPDITFCFIEHRA